jgi:4-hydroxy-tetrahydrodipicolinate reductase
MEHTMKLVVAGCTGRMGQTLMQYIASADGVTLVGGTALAGNHDAANRAYQSLNVQIHEDVRVLLAQADGVIDFTVPEYSVAIAQACAVANKVHVCGTTGFDEEQLAAFHACVDKAKIVHAPNMSIAVNLFMNVVEQVASILDDEFDIEIAEMHHRFKADAPSGTALGLGRAAAKGRGVELSEVADRGRDGITGPRKKGTIGFAALRGGDVVGDHTVSFAGMGERFELTHKASSREIYARGAVKAAMWAKDKPAGLYTMMDVLGL